MRTTAGQDIKIHTCESRNSLNTTITVIKNSLCVGGNNKPYHRLLLCCNDCNFTIESTLIPVLQEGISICIPDYVYWILKTGKVSNEVTNGGSHYNDYK